MSETVIVKGTIVTPTEMIPHGEVVVEMGKITYVGTDTDHTGKVYDFEGFVSPGFIDLHVHGGSGFDVMDASFQSLDGLSKHLSAGGTTSFLPTTYSAPLQNLKLAAHAVREATAKQTQGAKVLGIHLEGPYINPKRKGAHSPTHIRSPSIDELVKLEQEAGGSLRMVTLAPEVGLALEVAKSLRSKGIILSAGHTDATYEEMEAATEAGFTHVTHLFNAMRPFHHRDPGVVGAALTDERLTVELIADGLHLHPASLRLAALVKGSEKTVLASDSVMPAGLQDGEYLLGGDKVYLKDRRCSLESGQLAGSTIRLCDAVRNIVELADLPLTKAVEMASLSPARVLGLADRKGCLKPGWDADLTVFDQSFTVLFTMVEGRIVYMRGSTCRGISMLILAV